MQFLQAVAPAATSDDRADRRLATANMVIAALARIGVEIFGNDRYTARIEPMPNGGMRFIPATAGGLGIDLDGAVHGKERLLAGFRGSYSQQQLVRALATYTREGHQVSAAVLAQAIMGRNSRAFDQVREKFERTLQEFRFAGVFAKPRHIHHKMGPTL